MMTKAAVAYSNAVLGECENRAIYLSPLKLQKLIYLNYAIKLKNGGSFVEDLDFQAWRYGPVIDSIYYEYRHFGSDIIRDYLYYKGKRYELPDTRDVEECVSKYGHLHGYHLIDIVHRRDGAWWKSYIKGENHSIPHTEIKREFSGNA